MSAPLCTTPAYLQSTESYITDRPGERVLVSWPRRTAVTCGRGQLTECFGGQDGGVFPHFGPRTPQRHESAAIASPTCSPRLDDDESHRSSISATMCACDVRYQCHDTHIRSQMLSPSLSSRGSFRRPVTLDWTRLPISPPHE